MIKTIYCTTNDQHSASSMAPPHTQRISRQGRNAHKSVDEEPHEDPQTGYGAVNEESEDDISKLSQGTAVEKMIIGNLNDVC